MEPILHDLLSQWQDDPAVAPEALCQERPDLLPLLREQIAALARIEQLAVQAAGDDEDLV